MHITLTGFYGAGNTGDEAILSAIIESVRSEYPDATFTVLSFDPSTTAATHDVTALYRPNFGRDWVKMPFAAMYRAVETSDVVLVGGGGILQNVHNNMNAPRYLQTAVLAKVLGTPVVYYGVGAGPIDGQVLETQVRAVCNAGDSIIVRDENSKRCLESVGVDSTPITVGADPVFALNACEPDQVDDALSADGVTADGPLFGVSVRHHELPNEARDGIAQFLDEISADGFTVVFIPFGKGQSTSDRDVSRDIARRMETDTGVHVLDDGYTPKMILGFIERMDFVLGMRLHSVIMAAATDVPVLGIPYHPKVRSALHRLGYEERHYVASPSEATHEALSDAYSTIQAEPELEDDTREASRRLRHDARRQASSLGSISARPLGRVRATLLVCWFVVTTVLLRLSQLHSDLQR